MTHTKTIINKRVSRSYFLLKKISTDESLLSELSATEQYSIKEAVRALKNYRISNSIKNLQDEGADHY